MAEVEKKAFLSKWKLPIVAFIGLLLVSAIFLHLRSSYREFKREKARQKSKVVNPAVVSPETVAKAIEGKGQRPPQGKVPFVEVENVTEKRETAAVKPKETTAKQEKRKWKLPKPEGKLAKVSRPEYREGLPQPTGKIFPKITKREKSAEKMKVITPRLKVIQAKAGEEKTQTAKKEEKGETFVTVLAAGMFVPAVLSQGITAPIGYKVPVRFKLYGEAVGVGSYSFDLDSCVVLGAGKGIETGDTARIETELVRLSCQWPDGNLHTVPVTGYVVDRKDRKLHLWARLEENRSKIVLESFLQGAAVGAAEAAKKAQEVTQTTALNQNTSISSQEVKNEDKYIFWGGVAGALSQTQQMLQQKINKLQQLQTADREAGGDVYLVFTQDVKIPKQWIEGSKSKEYDFAGYEE